MIFQDIPDSSVGVPLEAVVHREGRITAERQAAGKRKGQWLFNRATVRSVDRLYDEFESKPIVPELVATGRPAERAHIPTHARIVDPPSASRLAQVLGSEPRDHLVARRVSGPRDGSCSCS